MLWRCSQSKHQIEKCLSKMSCWTEGQKREQSLGLCPGSHFRPLHSIPCIHQALQAWKGQWLGLCMHCARTEGRESNGSAPKWACIRLFLLCIDHDNRKIANTNIKEGRNTITDFQSTSKFKSSELMRQKTKDMDHFSRRETPGGNSCTYCYMTFFFLIFRKETTQWEQESPSYVVLRKAMPLHKSAAWPLSYPTSKSSTNKRIMPKVKQDTSQWRGHFLEYWSWLWFFDCDTKAQTDNS